MKADEAKFEAAELRRISARLVREFSPPLERDAVQACVDAIASQWAEARIRQYVPLFVERGARAALTLARVDSERSGDGANRRRCG